MSEQKHAEIWRVMMLVTRGTKLAAFFAAILFFIVAADRAQQPSLSHAQDFSSDTYYDPPNEQVVKTRLSGTEAVPMEGGRLLGVRQVMVQTFGTNSVLELTAHANQCVYDLHNGEARSPGHLVMDSGDRAYHVEGDGFMFVWRTNAMSLMLSNNVKTIVRNGILKI